jgi:hypothetical protein
MRAGPGFAQTARAKIRRPDSEIRRASFRVLAEPIIGGGRLHVQERDFEVAKEFRLCPALLHPPGTDGGESL